MGSGSLSELANKDFGSKFRQRCHPRFTLPLFLIREIGKRAGYMWRIFAWFAPSANVEGFPQEGGWVPEVSKYALRPTPRDEFRSVSKPKLVKSSLRVGGLGV